jgi:hypothetical protein
LNWCICPSGGARSFGKDHDGIAVPESSQHFLDCARIARVFLDRYRVQRADEPRKWAKAKEPELGNKRNLPLHDHRTHQRRIEERLMIRRNQHRTLGRNA